MRYLSVCSGIEAASVAWEPLGFTPVGFSEIDPFASAVLAERFGSNLPGEPLSGNAPPNFGDFTAIPIDTLGTVDLLVGGTPCQAFSFAGKRLSLADARGNLTLAFAVFAHELAGSHGLRNALWENVPGVLSTEDNAFGCFLGALVGADDALHLPAGIGRWPDAGMVAGPRARAAWRVLDAQYFGLAQRRERVFVVVDFGNGADPAAVLFEPQGLQGNSPPSREAGEGFAAAVAPSLTASGRGVERPGESRGQDPIIAERLAYGGGNRSGPVEVAATLTAKGQRIDFEVETFIAGPAHTLRAEGFDASEDGTGRGTPIVPVYAIQERAVSENPNAGPQGKGWQPDIGYTLEARHHVQAVCYGLSTQQEPKWAEDLSPTLALPSKSGGGQVTCVAFSCKDHGADAADEIAPTLRAMGHSGSHPNAGGQVAVAQGWAVRRLTPAECARLQGFADHHSRIAWRGKPAELCPDGPQYKTYGNSFAVNVVKWLGERIASAMPAQMETNDAA